MMMMIMTKYRSGDPIMVVVMMMMMMIVDNWHDNRERTSLRARIRTLESEIEAMKLSKLGALIESMSFDHRSVPS